MPVTVRRLQRGDSPREVVLRKLHARLLPTTTIIFLLPTDSSFSSVINAISKPISVQAAVQICKSLLNSDFHHYCVEDDIILANPLLQRENDCWKNRRLCGGGGDQQQVVYLSNTDEARALPALNCTVKTCTDSENNNDNCQAINESRSVSRKPE